MQWLFIALLAFAPAPDLTSIRAEPNLEHRSELALDYAQTALDEARDAYSAGSPDKLQAALQDIVESVDLAYDSLSGAVKNPRNNKYFKRAELKTRGLLRRLDGFEQSVGVDDRPGVTKVRDRVAEIHDNLLKGIMSKHK
jgi:hypothetical protein